MARRILIVDGTLREGEQTPGVVFTQEEKARLARLLDRLGVDILDAGMPAVSAEETESLRRIACLDLKARLGVSVRLRDSEIRLAAQVGARDIFLICPASPLHLEVKFGWSPEEGLERSARGVALGVSLGLKVHLVGEDSARAPALFLARLFDEGARAGAASAFFCDTLGLLTSRQIARTLRRVRRLMTSRLPLGIHCHNDYGLATANTLAALEAGAALASVTVNGLGERAGNAVLAEVALGASRLLGLRHGIVLEDLYDVSRTVEALSGILISQTSPVVGYNAFRHESGIHVDGLLKDPRTYEPYPPEMVGRRRTYVLGKHSGRSLVARLLAQRGLAARPEDVEAVLERVKMRKEAQEKSPAHRLQETVDHFNRTFLNLEPGVFEEIVEEVFRITVGGAAPH